ncbi:MAG: flagellar biosynthesis protein flip [Phycisphaerae bacterium SM23_33]|nr:MAG: flagellar biosynthesis protein flip [Phycisphaerae bacterium SM23_33]
MEKAAGPQPDGRGRDWSTPVKLAVVFAVLAILPSLLVMMTSFARIIIVLAFVRRALTTQNIPPTTAIIGLALFLTIFTMSPTFAKINQQAIQPYRSDRMKFDAACSKANSLLKEFMIRHTRKSDLALFVEMSGMKQPESPADVPTHVVIPSFAISEFRTAFLMGCLLFIPFLLIDLVVAGVLLSTGMMMLPPVIVSLPFKIILFVLVDGWQLLAKTLVTSFY